jgi:hypothetical protein
MALDYWLLNREMVAFLLEKSSSLCKSLSAPIEWLKGTSEIFFKIIWQHEQEAEIAEKCLRLLS